MARKKRLPDYSTIIGAGTEIEGAIRFSGGIHIDGKVIGDVSASSADGCALSLSQSGIIQGNLDVAHVVLDGAVIGDVRAAERLMLAPGARIDGNLFYDVLEMAEGAEVNGKLFRIGEAESPQLASRDVVAPEAGSLADSTEDVV
jgi:cytoskeletal protein CcmA (bactofilin family)